MQDPPSSAPSSWVWIAGALLAIAVALLWGLGGWRNINFSAVTAKQAPFYQVTNRQLSLFLWQFPEYMRLHASSKESYITGFSYENGKVNIRPGEAETFVLAPPQLLFLYHAWERLLKAESPLRPFTLSDLELFLQAMPEWLPDNWPAAPPYYRTLVSGLKNMSEEQKTQSQILPNDVQIALMGWKNFYQEREAIASLRPTFQQMASFLQRCPHYARNYWRNIVLDATPRYLYSLTAGSPPPQTPIPTNELTSFLLIAFFNDQKAIDQELK